MDVSGDELAGIVDLFGGLTRRELDRALEELAFKRGQDVARGVFDEDVEAALERYDLVAIEGESDTEAGAHGENDEQLLIAGPAAFPSLPEGADDLPHIMDVEERSVDRERAGSAARARLEADAAAALDKEDAERVAELLDASYDIEAWAPVDLADVRDHLDAGRE